MNKGFITVEQSMPARKQIPFQPALALVFTQHFHHAALRCQVLIIRVNRFHPLPVGGFKYMIQLVGERFIGTENPEVSLLPHLL